MNNAAAYGCLFKCDDMLSVTSAHGSEHAPALNQNTDNMCFHCTVYIIRLSKHALHTWMKGFLSDDMWQEKKWPSGDALRRSSTADRVNALNSTASRSYLAWKRCTNNACFSCNGGKTSQTSPDDINHRSGRALRTRPRWDLTRKTSQTLHDG